MGTHHPHTWEIFVRKYVFTLFLYYGKAIKKNDEKKIYIQTRMFMNVAWYYSRNFVEGKK